MYDCMLNVPLFPLWVGLLELCSPSEKKQTLATMEFEVQTGTNKNECTKVQISRYIDVTLNAYTSA